MPNNDVLTEWCDRRIRVEEKRVGDLNPPEVRVLALVRREVYSEARRLALEEGTDELKRRFLARIYDDSRFRGTFVDEDIRTCVLVLGFLLSIEP